MIGDRLDNDVAPAAGLGMATVRVRWPTGREGVVARRMPKGPPISRSLERVAARPQTGPGGPPSAVDDLRGGRRSGLGRRLAETPDGPIFDSNFPGVLTTRIWDLSVRQIGPIKAGPRRRRA